VLCLVHLTYIRYNARLLKINNILVFRDL
jgi:hypothetical protein